MVIYRPKKEKKEESQLKILAMAVTKLTHDLQKKRYWIEGKEISEINSPGLLKLLENLELILNDFVDQRCSTKA